MGCVIDEEERAYVASLLLAKVAHEHGIAVFGAINAHAQLGAICGNDLGLSLRIKGTRALSSQRHNTIKEIALNEDGKISTVHAAQVVWNANQLFKSYEV